MVGRDSYLAREGRPRIPADLVRHFSADSTQADPRQAQDVLDYVGHYGSPRRW